MFERIILRITNRLGKMKEFVLENERDYILGREADCSVVINDPFRIVSRRHCRITVHAPLVFIQDLGSRNGTQVNGVNIGCREQQRVSEEFQHEEYEKHPLDDGDTLQIGGYELQVKFDPSLPCAAAEPRAPEKLWSCNCVSC